MLGISSLSGQNCNVPLQNLSENFNVQPDPNDISVLPSCWSNFPISSQWQSSIPIRVSSDALYMFTRAEPTVVTPRVENAQGVLTLKVRKLSNTEDNSTLAITAFRLDNGTRVRVGSVPVNSRTFVSRTIDFSTVATAPDVPVVFELSFDNASNIVANVFIDDFVYKSLCTPSAPPVATARDITVQLDENGNATVNPASVNNGSVDECGEIITTFRLNKTDFTCDDLGDNTVTLTVTDSEGQTGFTTATVTVEPGFSFNNNSIVLGDDGTANPDIDYFTNWKTDCSGVTYTISDTNVDCTDIGFTPVTVTATYPGGTKDFTVNRNVVDTTPPLVATQNISFTIDNATGQTVITPAMIDDGSTDNCGIATMTLSKTTFTCSDQGENEVILTVTDNSGNSSTGTAIVTVESFIPEVNVTSDATSICFGNDGGNASATVSIDNSLVGARYFLRDDADNTIIDGPVTGTGSGLTFTTNTVSVSTTYHIYADFPGSGGAILCEREMTDKIKLGDSVSPTVATKNTTITIPASGFLQITPDMVDNGSTDDCTEDANLTYSLDRNVLGCDDTGNVTVTLTVTDEAGNSSSATAVITVMPAVANQIVSIADENLCTAGETTTVSLASSETGVNYYLRNSADNAVVAGPVAGTGNQLDLMTGAVNENTTFNVLGVTDFENKAISFNSPGNFISAPEIASFDYSKGYTFEAWVNRPAASAHLPILSIGNRTVSDVEIYVQQSTNDLIVFHDRGEASSGGFGFTDPPLNQWFHLAVTYNGTDIEVYYNGIRQNVTDGRFAPTSPMTKTNGTDLKIGEVSNSAFGNGGAFFSGQLDEFRIWDYARTATEINDNRSDCVAGNVQGLVANYKLDDQGTEILDATGKNNASLNNSSGASTSVAGAPITCTSCEIQMNNEVSVTVGDTEAPMVLVKNIVVILDDNNTATITAADVDNGSTDNCTPDQDLVRSIDVSSFDQTDIGLKMVTLTVTDASGNSNTATAEVTVSDKELQTVTFTGVEDKTFGDADFIITGSTNSNIPVTFSVVSGGLSVTTNQSGEHVFSITGAGTATVEASNTGNDNFSPLLETFTINIAKADQTITITPISDQNITESSVTVDATVNSGLDLSYAITSGPATISDNVISLNGTVGTVTVEVSQSGNDNYNAASENVSFEVVEKDVQTVVFTGVEDKTFGDPDFIISGTANSNLPIAFSVESGNLTAMLSESGGYLFSITGTGQATIKASNDGDDTYAPFSETFTIDIAKADQEITITSIADQVLTANPFDVQATVNSGLALSYAITAGPASIDGNTITLDGSLGTVTVSVSQSGNDNYNAASESVSFEVVDREAQTISFSELANVTYGAAAITLSASSSSSLPVEISLISGPGELNGQSLTIIGAGAIVLEATQAGDDNFLPAAAVRRTLTVDKAPLNITADDQTITFGGTAPELTYSISGLTNGDTEQDLNANISLSLSAGSESPLNAGSYDIMVSASIQSELPGNYEITTTNGTLTVAKADQVITLSPIEDQLIDAPAFDVVASVDSSLPLTYSVTGPATISGQTITLDGTPGTVVVTVSQEGTANFNSAEATEEFEVNAITTVGENFNDGEVSIYPNPVQDQIHLSGKTSFDQFRIISADGKVHQQDSIHQNVIDISLLKSGVYLLELSDSKSKITKRFIKL